MRKPQKISVAATLLLLLCASVRAIADSPPAFYSNMVFMFRSGDPVFMQSRGSGFFPGHLFEVVRIGERVVVISPEAVAPLHAYAEDLFLNRNLESSQWMNSVIEKLRAESSWSVPVLIKIPVTPGPATGPGDTEEPPPDWDSDIEKTDKKLDLQITGFRYFKYRDYSSSGNSDTFLSQSGLLTYGDKFEQGTNLNFTAKYEDLEVTGSINELPMQERDMSFDLGAGPYTAKLGDFTSTFKGGTLVSLDKRITGAEVDYQSDKYEFGFVASQSKSESKTISFNGDNTHGPYDLNTFEIVPDSVSVTLNGQPLSPNEYEIDYYSGEIKFCSNDRPPRCTNIKTSDTVQVEYEQKLLLSLKAGDIRGFRGSYNLPGGNGKIGAAYITQQANRTASSTKRNESETFTGVGLLAQGTTAAEQSTIQLTPTSTKYPGLVFMDKGTELITKNGEILERDIDYTIAYTGHVNGEIVLTDLPADGDSFVVEYSYYVDDFINVSREEDILDTGEGTNVFILARSAVYGGPEIVLYCLDENCATQELLQYGVSQDYTIDEANNSLIIHSTKLPNAFDDTFIRISYYYVPAEGPGSSEFDHTVQNIFGEYSIGDKHNISFEYATSNNDVSQTPIQIMNERVLTASATFTCETAASPIDDCIYMLENGGIEEDSEVIRLNTGLTALNRNVDYTLDQSTGRLVFTGGVEIPAGAVVYASYRYNPDVELGLVSGSAMRLAGNTRLWDANITFKKETTEPFFAPIGGNNTLETDRFEYTLSMPVSKKFNVDLQRADYDIAQDIFEKFVTGNTMDSTTLTYQGTSKLKTVTWTFGENTSQDNREIRVIDTSRENSSLEVDLLISELKNMSLKYANSTEDFSDLTGLTDNTSSSANEWIFSYKPRTELSVDLNLKKESVDTFGVTDPFSTSNTSRNVQLTYQPTPIITLTADIDSQRRSDSRPDSEATGVDTSSVRLTTLPFWKVRSLSYTITQQDSPSQFTGGSQSDVHNFTFTVGLDNGVSITPTSTISKSSTSSSSSKTTLNSIRLEYLPTGKKYETMLTQEWSGTDSSSALTDPTSSDTDRLKWDFKYKFQPNTHLTYRFSRYNTSSSTSDVDSGNNRNSLVFVHDIEGRLNIRATYTWFDRFGTVDSSDKQFELNTEYQLGKYLFWLLKYKLLNYSQPINPDENYSGKVLETELRLEF